MPDNDITPSTASAEPSQDPKSSAVDVDTDPEFESPLVGRVLEELAEPANSIPQEKGRREVIYRDIEIISEGYSRIIVKPCPRCGKKSERWPLTQEETERYLAWMENPPETWRSRYLESLGEFNLAELFKPKFELKMVQCSNCGLQMPLRDIIEFRDITEEELFAESDRKRGAK